MKWGSFILGLLFIAVLGAYISIKISIVGTELSVPDITNETVEDAYEILADKGLFLMIEGERNDDRIAEGKILSQEPPYGSKIRKGRKVKIIVSRGAKKIQTPELTGETERSARIKVTQDGMILGSVSYVNSEVGEGRVIAQSPQPGVEKLKGGSVNLLMSKGRAKRTYVMPDLIDKDHSVVESMFAEHGMRISSSRKETGLLSKHGTIISQHPALGFPVTEGDTINITVLD